MVGIGADGIAKSLKIHPRKSLIQWRNGSGLFFSYVKICSLSLHVSWEPLFSTGHEVLFQHS
jgi:hypothetical protein